MTPRCCADERVPVVTLAADAGALDGLTAAAFVPGAGNGEPLLATVGTDKVVHLWSWREGKLLQSVSGLTAPAHQLLVSLDGKTLAAAWNFFNGDTRDAQVCI